MAGSIERFLPVADVQESHEIEIAAPADIVFECARQADLMGLPVISTIFRAREFLMGAHRVANAQPKGLVDLTTHLGWRPLVNSVGRELVMGALAQPWLPDVVFRGMAPEEFVAFAEPGWVKIVWTLEAIPITPGRTLFRTQTRVQSTDTTSKDKFRRYWRKFGIGIVLIRRILLPTLRRQAERRFHDLRG